MKKITLIPGILFLALSVSAQQPACDCADCRAQAAAAAAGKQFTLPGLEGLNQPATNTTSPTEAETEEHTAPQTAAACGDDCASEHACAETSHEEHAHSSECNHSAATKSVAHDHDGDGESDHDSHAHATEDADADSHQEHDHHACGGGKHDDHAGHDHGDSADGGIKLSQAMIEKIGLKVLQAQGGTVALSSTFPATIQLNRDRTASVSPRFPSLVRQVFGEIGDTVKKGDVLASLENRETMAVYTVSAPQDGVIIQKDFAVGETAGEEDILYTVTDLTSVWADISIFPEYKHLIRKGLPVTLIAQDGDKAQGTIQYIHPIMSHETRTITARCVLEGADGDFTPGSFIRAEMVVQQVEANVVVPREAVQRIDGESVVFIPTEQGFIATPVRLGAEGETDVEILGGLQPNAAYVAAGAFTLKSQMVTSGMDPHAGHGH